MQLLMTDNTNDSNLTHGVPKFTKVDQLGGIYKPGQISYKI